MPEDARSKQSIDPTKEQDPGALDEAEEKLALRKDAPESAEVDPTLDSSEEHDPDALEEADQKLLRREK